MSLQKFPWVQFLSSLVFYVVIAVFLYVLSSLLPSRPAPQQVTPQQAQQLQQQQQVEQTKAIYQQVLTAVNRKIMLPQNTLPQISVVQDLQTFVAQNPVFAGASVGDIVLIYPDRVIVYSPKTDQIINSVLIPASAQQRNTPPAGTTTPPPQSAPQASVTPPPSAASTK